MIRCGHYDYIELVCLFRYPIELTLKSGEMMTGVARDTVRNQAREECILLCGETGEALVILDRIHKLKVLVENPHFKEVVLE